MYNVLRFYTLILSYGGLNMFKGQCILHVIIALSTCFQLGGLLVPSYVMLTISLQNDTDVDCRLYLGVWYSVACQKSGCDVFFSGNIRQVINWKSLPYIHWEKVPFVDNWIAFAILITTAFVLCCVAAVIFTKNRGCKLNSSSSWKRSELIVITVLLGLNVCITFVTLVLYFKKYPTELPATVKEEFQVALFLSSLGSGGAIPAVGLCVLVLVKTASSRNQSSSSHVSQGEAPIPMTSSAPTNQNDPNCLQSFDSIAAGASSSYQIPLQPPSETHKLEPSAPPPPWWWNP